MKRDGNKMLDRIEASMTQGTIRLTDVSWLIKQVRKTARPRGMLMITSRATPKRVRETVKHLPGDFFGGIVKLDDAPAVQSAQEAQRKQWREAAARRRDKAKRAARRVKK